jgi:hypothetical protein
MKITKKNVIEKIDIQAISQSFMNLLLKGRDLVEKV